MITEIKISCPNEFDISMENLKETENVFILVTSAINPQTGKSWCPDCVAGKSLCFVFFSLFSIFYKVFLDQ